MHLHTVTRGHKPIVDNVINQLQKIVLRQRNNGVKTLVGLGVRPVQLWEFIFPEEHLDLMLSTLNYRDNNPDMYGLNPKFAILRKMLKLKKIPKLDYDKIPRIKINTTDVAFHHIGYKEDDVVEGTELL